MTVILIMIMITITIMIMIETFVREPFSLIKNKT